MKIYMECPHCGCAQGVVSQSGPHNKVNCGACGKYIKFIGQSELSRLTNKQEGRKMPKLGISIKIDVTKIDKNRLFKGQKGTYLDLTTFIDTDNPGQYGDHGFISQSVTKDERNNGVQTPILGNVKVFYQGQGQQGGYQNQGYSQNQGGGYQNQGGYQQQGPPQGQNQQPPTAPDDDIPF